MGSCRGWAERDRGGEIWVGWKSSGVDVQKMKEGRKEGEREGELGGGGSLSIIPTTKATRGGRGVIIIIITALFPIPCSFRRWSSSFLWLPIIILSRFYVPHPFPISLPHLQTQKRTTIHCFGYHLCTSCSLYKMCRVSKTSQPIPPGGSQGNGISSWCIYLIFTSIKAQYSTDSHHNTCNAQPKSPITIHTRRTLQ